jgi:hypothetical protein
MYFVLDETGKPGEYNVVSCQCCESAVHMKRCSRGELNSHLIGRANTYSSSSSKAKAKECSKVLPHYVQEICEELGIPHGGGLQSSGSSLCSDGWTDHHLETDNHLDTLRNALC